MSDRQLFIGGAWTDGKSTERLEVMSPVHGEHLGSVPVATGDDIDAAVAAVREGQRALEAMTVYERAELLHRAAGLLEERLDELARELTIEQGKPLATEPRVDLEHTRD